MAEVFCESHPRHLGDGGGHLDSSRATADLNER
jgi:hypothetical protein